MPQQEVSKVYMDPKTGNTNNIVGPDGHKDGPHDHIIVNDKGVVVQEIIRTENNNSGKNK